MKYLNSYVQRPTTAPSPSSFTGGSASVAHRRKNISGGYSEAVILSGVSLPNTLTYQGYNDSGNLAQDEILVQLVPGDNWRKVPQSGLNLLARTTTIPSTIPDAWETVTPAELADNQATYPINLVDFGTFNAASEPSQTVYLLNDGTDTVTSLDFTVVSTDGVTLAALDGRCRVDYQGVYGVQGIGSPNTAANGSLLYAIGGQNSYPITIAPGGAAKITLNLVNFPAVGLDSTALEAEFLFNPNRSGFSLPTFLDWGAGGLNFSPNRPTTLLTEDPDSVAVLVAPLQARVGNLVYVTTTETRIFPTAETPGTNTYNLYVTDVGTLGASQTSLDVPAGAVVLVEFSYNDSTGEIFSQEIMAQPQATRHFIEANEVLTPGRSVKLDATGRLIAGIPSLGVAASIDGYYVPYGYVLVEVSDTVTTGETLAPVTDGTYAPNVDGRVVALADGGSGDLVLAFHLFPAGSGGGGGGATNLTFTRNSTTVTVESDTGTDAVLPAATTSLAGVMTSGDKTKLDGISPGATVSNLGNTPTSSTIAITNSGGFGTTLTSATTSLAGVMSAADKTKLDSLTPGGGGGEGATNLTFTRNSTTVTVESDTGTDAVLPAATTSLAGVMTSGDRIKLNGISPGATVSNLTVTTSSTTVDILNTGGAGATLPAATTSLAGVMSAADKVKLSGGDTVKIGSIIMFAGTGTPAQYLECDGLAVGRVVYPELFAAIGTTWGAGNGVTTFNLPDLRGRAPIGAGTGHGLLARILGTLLGSQTHQLTVGELPAHAHTMSSLENLASQTPPGFGLVESGGFTDRQISGMGTGIPLPTSSVGSGTAHNNMQPSAVVRFLIYAGA